MIKHGICASIFFRNFVAFVHNMNCWKQQKKEMQIVYKLRRWVILKRGLRCSYLRVCDLLSFQIENWLCVCVCFCSVFGADKTFDSWNGEMDFNLIKNCIIFCVSFVFYRWSFNIHVLFVFYVCRRGVRFSMN